MRRGSWVMALVLWLILPAFVKAASYEPISDQALVQAAEMVVTGQVVAKRSVDCPELRLPVCTVVEVDVEEVLAGDGETRGIEVLMPGGRFEYEGQLAEVVSSLSPVLWPGDEVLLLLDAGDGGVFRLSSGALSAFVAVETLAGQRLGLRQLDHEGGRAEGAGTARDFDRFAAAIARGLLDADSYWIARPPGAPDKLTRKSVEICPDLPVLVSLRWFVKGQLPGFTLSELRPVFAEALAAWNETEAQLDIQFFGQTEASEEDILDGLAVIFEDDGSVISPDSNVLAAASHLSICRQEKGYREITDAQVRLAPGITEIWARPENRPQRTFEEVMAHEFGHTLGIGHSCGGFTGTQCDEPYLNQAIMRAFAHGDGRGAVLNGWDQDQIMAVFLNNPEACVEDTETLCLNGGRFRLTVEWEDFENRTGSGRARGFPDVDDSGLFWFFAPDNLELLVKVLDACSFNDRFWVFAAATTNVAYSLRVEDSFTGIVRTYENQLGIRAPAVTDTEAFASCPDALP